METLNSKLINHLTLLEAILQSSAKILEFTKKEMIDEISFETENKGRLIKRLSVIQLEIEKDAAKIPSDLLTLWRTDYNSILRKIDELTMQTLAELNQIKESTSKEISIVYKNRQSLKGYNLNDLRK